MSKSDSLFRSSRNYGHMNSQVTSLRESHMTPSNGILLPSRSALWFHKDDTLLDQAKFHTYTKKQVYPWHYPISYCIRNHNHTFKQDPRHLTIAAQKTIFMSDAAYSTVLASHHRYFIAHSLIYISLIAASHHCSTEDNIYVRCSL